MTPSVLTEAYTAVSELTRRARQAQESKDAMCFAQAALNAAHAVSILNNISPPPPAAPPSPGNARSKIL